MCVSIALMRMDGYMSGVFGYVSFFYRGIAEGEEGGRKKGKGSRGV